MHYGVLTKVITLPRNKNQSDCRRVMRELLGGTELIICDYTAYVVFYVGGYIEVFCNPINYIR